jgi:hypothetical protein
MKQIITLLVVAFLFGLSFSFQSCHKCTTCKYTYVVLGQTLTYEYPEVCGDSQDINDLEELCAMESAAVNGDCSCD